VVLTKLQRFSEAAEAGRRATELQPSASTYNNLVGALTALGRADDAIAACRKAIELDPNHHGAHNNLGSMLGRIGRHADAVTSFRRALALVPNYADALHGLGFSLDRLGDRAGAIAAIDAALKLKDDPAWRFELEAMRGAAAPATAPAEFVRALFDQAATTFDQTLRENLHYRTPEHLFAAVTAVRRGDGWDIMDLGCGTGLAATLFRSLARRLVGVDLSSQMIEQAKKRNLYDELSVGDVVTALQASAVQFDLIIAADVFVYIGDLGEVFAAAAAALKTDALFAFSVERHEGEGYALRPQTRRFVHSEPYLKMLSQTHRFEVASLTTATLRRESGSDVVGLIVVLRRP
jgi:predicted TPR repeat methyltransferase